MYPPLLVYIVIEWTLTEYDTLSKNNESNILDVGPLEIDDSDKNILKFKFNIALNLKSLKDSENVKNNIFTRNGIIIENDTNTETDTYPEVFEEIYTTEYNAIVTTIKENYTKNEKIDTGTEKNDTYSEESKETYSTENNII